MTRRRLRIALIAAGAIVVLVVAALAALPLFVDAERLRPLVERMARERLGREVTFESIEVDALPLPSVVVGGLRVAGTTEGEPWISARALRVQARLAPLLRGRVEATALALDEPVIRLLRAPDGRWNLVDMVRRDGDDQPPQGERRVPLDRVSVRDGRLLLADAFVHPGRVERLEVSGVDGSVRGLRRGSPYDVEVEAAIASRPVAWSGTIGPGRELDGRARADALDVAALSPWLESFTGMAGVQGTLSGDLEVERGDGGDARAQGWIETRGARLPIAAAGSRPLDARADLQVALEPGGRADVRRFDVTTGETRLRARGKVLGEGGDQVLEVELDPSRLRMSDAAALLGAFGLAMPQLPVGGDDVSLAGRARVVRTGSPRSVRSIALDGVRLKGARVVLRRGADGSLGLGGGAAKPSGGGGPEVRARDVELEDLAVALQGPDGARPILEDARLTVASWAPGQSGRFELSGRAAGGRVDARGELGAPGGGASDVTVRLDRVDLDALQAAAGGAGARTGGTLSGTSRLTGRLGTDLSAKGELRIAGARVTLPTGKEVTIDAPVRHDVRLLDQGRIAIETLVVGLPGGELPVTGRIQRRPQGVSFDLATQGRVTLAPESVRFLLGLAGDVLPVDLQLEEPLALDARVRRVDGRTSLEGDAELQRATVRHAALGDRTLDVARARVSLSGESIALEDALVRLGGTSLSGWLGVEGFAHPRLRFDLASDDADLDELFSFFSGGPEGRRGGGGRDGGGSPSLVQRMSGSGRLAVRRATLGGLELSAFDSKVAIGDGRLEFAPVELQLYGGRAGGRVVVDLATGQARFETDTALESVDVGALLAAGVGSQQLTGTGRSTLQLSGSAGGLEEALRSVSGTGLVSLSGGEIRGLNMLASLEKASVFGERSLSELAGRLSRDGTTYETLEGRFEAQGGSLRLHDVLVRTPDGDIQGSGTVDMLSQALDMDALILFGTPVSEAMRAEGSRAADLFWDDQRGRVVLPVRFTGTVKAPKASIDWDDAAARIARRQLEKAVAGGIDEQIKSGGGDLLGGLLGVGRERPPAPAEPAAGEGDGARARDEGPFGGWTWPGSGASEPPAQDGAGEGSQPAGAAERADAGEAPREEAARVTDAPAGAPRMRFTSTEFSGNVLAPDLRVEGTVSGADPRSARLVVSAPDGTELLRMDEAFAGDLAAWRASAAGADADAVPVGARIDGKRLVGQRSVVVTVRVVDGAGAAGPEARATVERPGPF